MNGIHEVTGSTPVWSTILRSSSPAKDGAYSNCRWQTSGSSKQFSFHNRLISIGTNVALLRFMPPKRFVYVLKSQSDCRRFYTGVTANLRNLLVSHNAGECRHTATHRPWELDVVIGFRDEGRALKFERYLKSGSGVAFAKRQSRGFTCAATVDGGRRGTLWFGDTSHKRVACRARAS